MKSTIKNKINKKMKKISRSEKLKKLIDLEIDRNLIHLIGGGVIAIIVYSLSKSQALQIIAVGSAIGMLIMDKARRNNVPFVSFVLERAERDGVEYPIFGTMNFVIGSLLAVVFLPKNAAVLGIVALAIVDSFSTLYGKIKRFKKEKKIKLNGKKTLQGAIGGFLPFLFFLFCVVQNPAVAFFTALCASITELITPIDDNLVLPIVTGSLFLFFLMIF